MTKALIGTIREWRDSQPEPPTIQKVHLVVGAFTCVEPASLRFAFDVQTQGTFLDGTQLVIKDVPLVAHCHTCHADYRPEFGSQYACPICNSPMEDIRSGRELKIDRLECIST